MPQKPICPESFIKTSKPAEISKWDQPHLTSTDQHNFLQLLLTKGLKTMLDNIPAHLKKTLNLKAM